MLELEDSKYHITYDFDAATITCEGSLSLNGAVSYEPLLQLLKQAAEEQEPNALTINLYALKFMNSSGINMLTKFIMHVSDVKKLQLTLCFQAKKRIAWQEKLCINLQRLLPSLKIELLD